jgi:hypothetical protein
MIMIYFLLAASPGLDGSDGRQKELFFAMTASQQRWHDDTT